MRIMPSIFLMLIYYSLLIYLIDNFGLPFYVCDYTYICHLHTLLILVSNLYFTFIRFLEDLHSYIFNEDIS